MFFLLCHFDNFLETNISFCQRPFYAQPHPRVDWLEMNEKVCTPRIKIKISKKLLTNILVLGNPPPLFLTNTALCLILASLFYSYFPKHKRLLGKFTRHKPRLYYHEISSSLDKRKSLN